MEYRHADMRNQILADLIEKMHNRMADKLYPDDTHGDEEANLTPDTTNPPEEGRPQAEVPKPVALAMGGDVMNMASIGKPEGHGGKPELPAPLSPEIQQQEAGSLGNGGIESKAPSTNDQPALSDEELEALMQMHNQK